MEGCNVYMKPGFGFLNWVVIIVYLAGMLAVGIFSQKEHQKIRTLSSKQVERFQLGQ